MNGRGVGEGVGVGATVGAVVLLAVVEGVTTIAKDDGVGGPLGLGSGLQAASGTQHRRASSGPLIDRRPARGSAVPDIRGE